jgi:hypothetical protein
VEVVAYNRETAHTYVLQAHDMSLDAKGSAPARRAFAAFQAALLRPIGPACARQLTVRFPPFSRHSPAVCEG